MPNLIGQSFGRYQLLEKLGEGGMAIVYKAYDTRLETEVAVKVIQTESLPQNAVERALKRFEREAKALARLTHQNIVKVTDYGEYEGQPYLVMPFLPGGTLKTKLGKPIAWQEAVQLLLPVAEALGYAHSQNMIHRDVKPANILLTQSGHPMLTDFGIAKLLDLQETVDLTGTSAAIGTPEYMAPEQASAKNVDHRADIYALGIVLYEMVTGRKPFVADTPMEVLIMQARDPLPSPKKYAPNLSDRGEKILLKALAKRPEDRYQTMAEFSAALEGKMPAPVETRAQPDRTVTIPEPPAREPTISMSQPRSKQAWLAWGAVGVVAALICLGVGGTYIFQALFPPSTPAVFLTELPAIPLPATESLAAQAPFTEPPTQPPSSLSVGSTWTSPKDGMIMLYVPAGDFSMGSDQYDDEKPIHDVYLDSYWMDQTEVTNAMYAKCMQAGKCDPPSSSNSYTHDSYYGNSQYDDYPVIYVSWNNAKAYCEWRGDGTRLPTEAEWEKAAGWDDAKKEKRVYPWGNTFVGSLLNFCDKNCSFDWADKSADDGYADTSPVGNYPGGASFYGALDMAGNIWEWVADWYDAYPGNNASNDSYGTKYRVLRGGSWYSNGYGVRSSSRGWSTPGVTSNNFGFRCARSLP